MNRRFVALLLVFAIGLQAPIVAYAAAVIPTGSALTTPADCPGRVPGHSNTDTSCCTQGALASACCAGSIVFATVVSFPVLPPALAGAPAPAAAHSVSFATESPGPELRPPIA
jgi:hypothetical protein